MSRLVNYVFFSIIIISLAGCSNNTMLWDELFTEWESWQILFSWDARDLTNYYQNEQQTFLSWLDIVYNNNIYYDFDNVEYNESYWDLLIETGSTFFIDDKELFHISFKATPNDYTPYLFDYVYSINNKIVSGEDSLFNCSLNACFGAGGSDLYYDEDVLIMNGVSTFSLWLSMSYWEWWYYISGGPISNNFGFLTLSTKSWVDLINKYLNYNKEQSIPSHYEWFKYIKGIDKDAIYLVDLFFDYSYNWPSQESYQYDEIAILKSFYEVSPTVYFDEYKIMKDDYSVIKTKTGIINLSIGLIEWNFWDFPRMTMEDCDRCWTEDQLVCDYIRWCGAFYSFWRERNKFYWPAEVENWCRERLAWYSYYTTWDDIVWIEFGSVLDWSARQAVHSFEDWTEYPWQWECVDNYDSLLEGYRKKHWLNWD